MVNAFNHTENALFAKLELIKAYEAQRPVWEDSKDHPSLVVSHQIMTAALSSIWSLLGVFNQTQAMEKLRGLVGK
jgi:hypothetical protein